METIQGVRTEFAKHST